MNKLLQLLSIFVAFHLSSFAQENSDWADEKKDWTNEENTSSKFFVGINAGALFANSNTASIYTGASNITPYGIDYILNVPNYKMVFDTYFQYPYAVSELPQNPAYKTAFDIGLHAGMNLGGGNTIFMDLNTSKVKFEQSFTMEIKDPNNQLVEPNYEQFPIIGEEERFNFNLGTQLSLLNKEKTNIYWSIFGNFNSIKFKRNYIVIDGKEYEIIHSNAQLTTPEPGGIGFGAGSGLGFKYKLTDRITLDLTYNLYYIKTKMNDNIQDFGINNGVLLRLIWG